MATPSNHENPQIAAFGVVVAFTDSESEADLWTSVDAFIADRTPQAVLQAESDWWDAWHAGETLPTGLTSEEQDVYRQSTAVLKMGQVRETAATGCPSDKCHGQIQLYAAPGYRAAYLTNDERQAIFENQMLPFLRA